MVHPDYTKHIHQYIDRIWRGEIKLDPAIPGIKPIPLSREKAKEIFSTQFPQTQFRDGFLVFRRPVFRNQAYWRLLNYKLHRGELKQAVENHLQQLLDPQELCHLAGIEAQVLGREAKARELLKLAEKRASWSCDFLQLALNWYLAFNDVGEVQGFLKKALERSEWKYGKGRCREIRWDSYYRHNYVYNRLKNTFMVSVREILPLFLASQELLSPEQQKEMGLEATMKDLEKGFEANKSLLELPGYCELAQIALGVLGDREKAGVFLELANKAQEEKLCFIFVDDIPEYAKNRAQILGDRDISSLLESAGLSGCGGWMLHFKDKEKVREILLTAQKEPEPTVHQLIEMARCYKHLLGENRKAKELFKNAENLLKKKDRPLHEWIEDLRSHYQSDLISDYQELAMAALVDLEDKEKAKHYLEKAEAKAGCDLTIARFWLRYLGEEDRAREIVLRSVNPCSTTKELCTLARFCRDYLFDEGPARKLLQLAGKTTSNVDDDLDMAKEWSDAVGDNENAREFLERAAEKAQDTSDRLRIVRSWQLLFPGTRETREHISKLQKQADSLQEFIQLAWIWQHQFKEMKAAGQALDQAERFLNQFSDCLTLAEAWLKLDRPETAAMLLIEAGIRAETPQELEALAKMWEMKLSDPNRAREIREKARGLVN